MLGQARNHDTSFKLDGRRTARKMEKLQLAVTWPSQLATS
jgi:hypothetical protein